MYIDRAMEKTVLQIQNSFPVLLITGPRQVGKTTMLKRLADENRRYVTLDDPLLRELAVSDPALFLQRFETPIIIDEIQYAPQLLPYIKMQVDKNGRNGDFWLTGSQMFHLMKNASESLAGRVGIVNLLGLANSELTGQSSIPFNINPEDIMRKLKTAKPLKLNEVFARIYRGSMPALYANDNVSTDLFFSSYVQTYLQRDIKDLTQVGDELSFIRFLTCVAARTGQMLNYAEMAKDTGISPPTAKQWLSILVSSGLVALVEPYFNNVLKRMIKSPKMYFLDTGLCAYLTKWTTPEALEFGAMSGAFFETWVVSEIIKSYYNAGKKAPLFYYRDKDQREIDLIIHENNTLYPIEIKKSGNPSKDAIRHFGVLEKTGLNIGNGCVICLASDFLPIDKKNWLVPAWLI
ncbi:ATP-binding protein [Desulfitobacterium sp.]|uniref:ATP-binding protein n=1 Tax=Desulfitobacterium sp. TaxID=49981 RepID=UPI002CE1E8DE|nr:ATP-binding protein [Desulfitobacterium sp.]HVJ50589.1 ATP-binding protein [Desulfitobacterium sp.]